MATPLVEKIEKDFLSCCICLGELSDPVGLPCLHGFCFKCLDKWFTTSSGPDKSRVTCPTCKESFPTPKDGIRGFPKHFLIKNLKETVELEKKGTHVKCCMCDKKAENHCLDCKKSLCQQCLRNHDGFIKDHKVITIQEYQSGGVSDKGRFCKVHGGEKVRYYCETEERGVCVDCVGLKTCPAEHHRISLEEAAQKQKALLRKKAKTYNETRAQFQDAVDEVKIMKNNLKHSSKTVNNELDKLESDYIQRVKQQFDKIRGDVKNIEIEKERKLDNSLQELELGLGEIVLVCDQVSTAEKSTSEYLLTYKYQSLFEAMTQLSKSKPHVADPELGYLIFEPVKSEVPVFGYVVKSANEERKWKLSSSFVAKGLNKLQGIAIDKNGYVVISSSEQGVKAFSKHGEIMRTIHSHRVPDVAVTADGTCLIPTLAKSLQCSDMQGNKIFDTPILDVNNTPSHINSVAIDNQGRIIVGQLSNTISIHNPDGSCISKFSTESIPYRLAVTPNEGIVTTYYDHIVNHGTSVVLMDYYGGNVRIIQPPIEVTVWEPSFLCCRQDEIYVINTGADLNGVYKYATEGRYMGCVTTEVKSPTGIALSNDGTELYVAEYNECTIKIFTKE